MHETVLFSPVEEDEGFLILSVSMGISMVNMCGGYLLLEAQMATS